MTTLQQAASDFLACDRIAVTGVSRTPGSHGGNAVYRRLRDRGYHVFAVNPNADLVEGDQCFHSLADIPGGVEAVVVATAPDHAMETVHECEELGIPRVWMHKGIGHGSVSEEAAEDGRRHGITVIDGACPLMFEPAADGGHKAMRFAFRCFGRLPHDV